MIIVNVFILEAMELTSPNFDLPMLYGYALEEMLSCHDGVRCYRATRRDSEEDYILKVISIPASKSKLDALLLTGALADEQAALAYFKKLAKDLIRQAELLQKLSQQEGFTAYLDYDLCPMEDGVGYYVCLLGTYKQSLDSALKSDTLTHADILHMGLDLCAALAACRRAGMLYADLKPGNVYYDPEQGCRIGDVGFIALPSLSYACLPDKYRSSYTAPELFDDFAVLNPTVDVYALGMMLYQAYNGGTLPFDGAAPAEKLPAPLYADYEMAEILVKACHSDPSQRWQDPTQFAQALMSYMQQFGAPETPIVPPVPELPEEEEEEEVEDFLPEADPEQLLAEIALLEAEEAAETAEAEDAAEIIDTEDQVGEDTAVAEEMAEAPAEDADEPDVLAEEGKDEDPEEEEYDLEAMLIQADNLIAHEPPTPPMIPDITEMAIFAADTQAEEPAVEAEEHPQADTAESEVAPASPAATEEIAAETPTPEEAQEEKPKKKFKFPKWILISALLILVAIALFSCGKHYYDNIYTLRVESMVLENTLETVTVRIVTDADESLLQITCSDSYGNAQESDLVNGIACFEGLKPSTRYTVRVQAKENHRVIGHITDTFTTPEQTTILSFIASVGPEDCSVTLNFTVDGPNPGNWIVRYSAEGIPEQSQLFTGRNTTIYGLTEGLAYTFTLQPQTQLYMDGVTQVTFQATNILCAKNLAITACGNGSLTAQWQQPDNGTVQQWRVRCYNDAGYDVTVTTDQCSYTFTELSHEHPCTVEVTAVDMNRSVTTRIAANPITIENFTCTITDEMALLVTWDHIGPAPLSWLISVSIDGSEPIQLATEKNELLLMLLPGSTYGFEFVARSGGDILQNQYSYTTSDVVFFTGFGLEAAELGSIMCLNPTDDVRDWAEYLQENYRISFTFGETAAILLQTGTEVQASEDAVLVQFVIHNAYGRPLHMNSATMIWDGMWQDGNCCLTLPYLPEVPGSYTLTLYFDGQFVTYQEFTID